MFSVVDLPWLTQEELEVCLVTQLHLDDLQAETGDDETQL